MSGGVDSSVTAALLKKEGHDVHGISLKVYSPAACQKGEEKTCCSSRDIDDARRVAAGLDIPFSSWDIREDFERDVIAPFVAEYRAARTPNPCVLCNSRIKFSLLLEKVRAMGADCLATGHYAIIDCAKGGARLRKGTDEGKDQSYFLFDMGTDALAHTLFPLGGLEKGEVRALARNLGMSVADKKESQEICFVPGNDYGAFVESRIGPSAAAPGDIRDLAGTKLGVHRGLIHYTVGQRRGLGISAPEPLYVVRLERESNTVVVGPDEKLGTRRFAVERVTWLRKGIKTGFMADVKIRSRHGGAPAILDPVGSFECRVTFDRPERAVTPGQAAVFYDGDVVVGGGWIADREESLG